MLIQISKSHLFSLTTLFFFIILAVDATAPNPLDFIVKCCNVTSSPRLCQRSLIPFAAVVKTDLKQAVQIVVQRSHAVARRQTTYITNLSKQISTSKPPTDKRVVDAVNYCVSQYQDTVSQLGGPTAWLKPSFQDNGEDFPSLIDDCDMNIALAISYMGECLKKWNDIPDGPVKSDVVGRSTKVQVFATNARDLLTSLDKRVTKEEEENQQPASCPLCVCCPDVKVPKGGCCKCCDAPPMPSLGEANDIIGNL